MKFTVKAIASLGLSDGRQEAIFFDDDIGGFGLRLRQAGSKNWIFQYKLGSKQRRLTFGTYPAIGLEQARRTAAELQARVRLGQDPAADKFEARARAAETVEVTIKQFLARQEKRLRPRSFKEVERHLLVHARSLHREPLRKVNRRTIASVLASLQSNGNHVRASLSAFFSWAMREGLVDANPVAMTNKPSIAVARERTLSSAELRDIWEALEDDDYGDILRLLALTGARRDEIGSLAWAEIDFERRLVSLPATRVKNKRPFDIPLSDQALAVLRERFLNANRVFVFGRGKGGFSGWSACKARLDARIARSRAALGKPAMPPWVLHDLRRTLSTQMHEKLGVQPHIVEAVLNHVSGHQGGVAWVYNRATYIDEKRRALEIWAGHFLSIVGGFDSDLSSRSSTSKQVVEAHEL